MSILTRRRILIQLLGTAAPAAGGFALSADDGRFLEELEKASLQFFLEQASPESGLVRAR